MAGLVINLPYTSQNAPPAVAKRLALSPEAWQLEHWRLIDPYLAEIVQKALSRDREEGESEPKLLAYPYSPLVADPWGGWTHEFLGEDKEAARPAFPNFLPRLTTGAPLNWTAAEAETILARSVVPFHRAVTEAALELLEKEPAVLVVSIRSFNSVPWNFEADKRYPRPQVCVGTAEGATPEGLAALAGHIFSSLGWWPERDRPQRGAPLPPGLMGRPRVKALGLSLSRGLYMDEKTGRKKPEEKSVIRVLRTALHLLTQELERVARVRLERAKPKPPRKRESGNILKAAP